MRVYLSWGDAMEPEVRHVYAANRRGCGLRRLSRRAKRRLRREWEDFADLRLAHAIKTLMLCGQMTTGQ